MGYVKVIKNKAYFKRFQVKFARRRAGKTDYRQRQRLIHVDKNKYQTPKYRLVVRLSNRYVLCQVTYATLKGDKVLAQASSKELARYGLTVGLKNFAAAYCTGLLVARRLLKQLDMDSVFEGTVEPDGLIKECDVKDVMTGRTRHYWVEDVDEKRPFRCYLDVGVRATTKGARLFSALKGASDGGLDIPHNNRRFPGYEKTEDGITYAPEELTARIFGAHIAEHMEKLGDERGNQYSKYAAAGISGDDLEELYTRVHAAIRADPTASAKHVPKTDDKRFKKHIKKTHSERKEAVKEKLARRIAELRAAAGLDDEVDEED